MDQDGRYTVVFPPGGGGGGGKGAGAGANLVALRVRYPRGLSPYGPQPLRVATPREPEI
jgi:hypothetical protein